MRVNVETTNYGVYWKYTRKDKNRSNKGDKTSCLISILTPEKMTPVSKGEAILSDGDHFDKNTGRKVSLTRALSALNLSRDIRSVFWGEYNKMVKL